MPVRSECFENTVDRVRKRFILARTSPDRAFFAAGSLTGLDLSYPRSKSRELLVFTNFDSKICPRRSPKNNTGYTENVRCVTTCHMLFPQFCNEH